MKTYKGLFDDMVKPENIEECFREAAKRKNKRKDVAEIMRPERKPGDDSPAPGCLQEHVEALRTILIEETFVPPEHQKKTINESACGKIRDITIPAFKYEHVIHHCIIKQLQPIILHGLYEHALGSIPGRGCHDGKKTIEKWIARRKGKKFYVLKSDVRHCFDTEDVKVIEGKFRKIIKDEKFLRLMFAVLECEAKPTLLEELLAEIAEDSGAEMAALAASSLMEDEEILRGLPLGFVTSHWVTHLNYKEFDHKMKEEWGAEDYMRYADDLVVFGRSKKELHRIRKTAEEYLVTEMHQHMKRNWQVFRFEYEDKKAKTDGKKKKTRGRALDFMGFVFHYNRTTLRKSILKRSVRTAHRIAKKDRPTWYDAARMISYMGWYDTTDTYDFFKEHIKPFVNIRRLRKISSQHSRKEQKEHDRMVQIAEHGQA